MSDFTHHSSLFTHHLLYALLIPRYSMNGSLMILDVKMISHASSSVDDQKNASSSVCPMAKLPCPRRNTILYCCSAAASLFAISGVPEANSSQMTGIFFSRYDASLSIGPISSRDSDRAIAVRGWQWQIASAGVC